LPLTEVMPAEVKAYSVRGEEAPGCKDDPTARHQLTQQGAPGGR